MQKPFTSSGQYIFVFSFVFWFGNGVDRICGLCQQVDPSVIPITVGFASLSELSNPFQAREDLEKWTTREAAAKLQKSLFLQKNPQQFSAFLNSWLSSNSNEEVLV